MASCQHIYPLNLAAFPMVYHSYGGNTQKAGHWLAQSKVLGLIPPICS